MLKKGDKIRIIGKQSKKTYLGIFIEFKRISHRIYIIFKPTETHLDYDTISLRKKKYYITKLE